jgi:chromosome segregation ATPase
MLKKLIVRNYQCHKKRVLRFDPHVTAIIGPNDSGKSAILRALRWLCLNRPQGKSIIREGATNVWVTLFVDGHRIDRKSGKQNLYKLDGKSFFAFRSDVPDPIIKILNVDEQNFQRQHQAHQWFSLTPSQAAKEINRLVDLSTIDAVQNEIARELRSKKAELTVVEREIEEVTEQVQFLHWSVGALGNLGNLYMIWDRYRTKSHRIACIERLRRSAGRIAEIGRRNSGAASVAHKAGRFGSRFRSVAAASGRLQRLYAVWRAVAGRLPLGLPSTAHLSNALAQLTRLKQLRSETKIIRLKCSTCEQQLEKAKSNLEEALGGRCPTCGGILTNTSII